MRFALRQYYASALYVPAPTGPPPEIDASSFPVDRPTLRQPNVQA